MRNLVRSLRAENDRLLATGMDLSYPLLDAASEITLLRAEVEALRAMLMSVAQASNDAETNGNPKATLQAIHSAAKDTLLKHTHKAALAGREG